MTPHHDRQHTAALFPALAADLYRALLLAYERRKAAWVRAHPDATPAEYEAAIKRLCEEIGV